MNSTFTRFLILFFCLMTLTSALTFAGPGKPFNTIVFFGDSLTDNGNFYNYSWKYLPKSPPYFEGRFSNNYVWSDLIANDFADKYKVTATNYAFGGETAVLHNPRNGFMPYSLTLSRNNYLLRTAYSDRSKTLFIIWIGGNDYLPVTTYTDDLSTQVVDSIKLNIENLISHGGVNFIVVNSPDLGKTPYAEANGLGSVMTAFSEKHNEKLLGMIGEIQKTYPNVNINLFDVDSLFTDIVTHPDYYNREYNLHLKNLNQACWQGGYRLRFTTVDHEAAIVKEIKSRNKDAPATDFAHYIMATPDLMETYSNTKSAEIGAVTACDDPDANLFWDQIHPTKVIHQLMAIGMTKMIDEHYPVDKSQ